MQWHGGYQTAIANERCLTQAQFVGLILRQTALVEMKTDRARIFVVQHFWHAWHPHGECAEHATVEYRDLYFCLATYNFDEPGRFTPIYGFQIDNVVKGESVRQPSIRQGYARLKPTNLILLNLGTKTMLYALSVGIHFKAVMLGTPL